ncbi:MAG: zinc ribbon domain-containing protein [Eubacteriales bacterium]|nr:zinc ribbon domain-containing protein [Eubacteriales bacterium]MDD3199211.1 zinc ribbon domain-containing protein [Eubacteriales bacterium]MDD4629134.1 zinc ribbon domain-containing protein [Eubacteriales bacterium]
MYCRNCGNLLGDTDKYCQRCGEPTGSQLFDKSKETVTEEVVYNPPIKGEGNNKFFYTEDEPEIKASENPEAGMKDSVFNYISDTEEQTKEEKDISEQGDAADRQQDTSNEGEFRWNVYDFPKPRKTEDIEFNWKLEDYSQQEVKSDKDQALEETLFKEIQDESNQSRESDIDRFYTFNKKNEEFQELLDREYERMKRQHSGVLDNDIEPETEIEEPEIEITESETDVTESETETAEPDMETSESEAEPTTAESVAIDPESVVTKPETEFTGSESGIAEPEIEPNKTETELKQETLIEHNETEEQEGMSSAPMPFPISFKTEDEDIADEQEEKGHHIGRIILIIIAIILIAEIAILGIRYFAPDSAISDSINKVQTQVIGTVAGWLSGEDDAGRDIDAEKPPEVIDKDNNNETEDPPEVIAKPDPKPAADKNALITFQMGNNMNIAAVRSNEELAYQPGRDYGISDINNSKPLENNIWQTSEGSEPIYYDQSIVGTIIAFDSQWIDYVNTGNKSVFDLLKKDSKAYQRAVSFSKVGKVKETFKLLEIGEIRKGSNGFYVWVYEEMQVTEAGKIRDINYNWIYYLEPVEGEMKIVNYLNFR